MEQLFAIIFVLALIALVVGLFRPTALRLKDRKQVGKILGGTCLVSFIALGIVVPRDEKPRTQQAVGIENIPKNKETRVQTSQAQPAKSVQPRKKSKSFSATGDSPDPDEVRELKVVYAHLNRLHTELEDEFNRVSRHRKPSNAIRRNWGQFSNQWNQSLKLLRNKEVLKNPGMLNLKSVADKTKNAVEFYGSNLFLYWQLVNDRLNGKKIEQFQLDSLNNDIQQATADATKGLALLQSGVDDLEKWEEN